MPTEKASSRLRGTAALEHEDDERLLGADPARRDRHERREALRHLHEEDVAEALVDAERAEEEPDRHEAERPVPGLPGGDPAQVLGPVTQHGEALADALLEVVDVEACPEEADEPEDRQGGQQRERELQVGREEAEIESGQAAQRAGAGQHAERERVDEDRQAIGGVEEREHEQGRGKSRVRAAGNGAMGEVQLHGVAAPGGDDRVYADGRHVRRIDRRPRHPFLRVGGRDRVPPRAARAQRLQQVTADREPERAEIDRRRAARRRRRSHGGPRPFAQATANR